MGEIKDFIELYVEESDMIPEILGDLSGKLQENIQDELYPTHGWITGNLHDSIQSNIISQNNLGGVIEAYTMIEYAPWVNDGHTLRNGAWWEGYHFMEAGLEKTVAMYR